jgi:hypothetical protein
MGKIRQTSIDCYNQIKESGLLSKRRLQVFEAMLGQAPCTAGEIERFMNKFYGVRGGWKQLAFLRDSGVVYEVGTTTCSVTNRKVIEWDLTDNLPVKKVLKSKPTKKQKIEEVLELIITLGTKLPDGSERKDLRDIYKLVKDI